jgi:hypothetical protein
LAKGSLLFTKTASVELLGSKQGATGAWSKIAQARIASYFMDGGSAIDVEAALDSVADTYQISRDPSNYLFIPARANSADRPNENLDGWRREELLRFDPMIGRRVYSTYVLKPHFVNHNASRYQLARGVLLDAHYNDANKFDDDKRAAVKSATGLDRDNDEFTEVLIAVDTTKDPALADAYRNGSVYRFSMGCDVEATECAACGNVASTTLQFCNCVRNKHARRPVRWSDGSLKPTFEWCLGTRFAELSAVDDPADKDAEIQDGLLGIVDSKVHNAQAKRDLALLIAHNPLAISASIAPLLERLLAE